jgi:hypothetical protein
LLQKINWQLYNHLILAHLFFSWTSGIWMQLCKVWLSLVNQHPIGRLIVSKQNWAVKQQWEGAFVHDLRHDDPLCQPVYHVFCFHRNGIQATKETCLGSNSVRMCKSVQETLSEKVSAQVWTKDNVNMKQDCQPQGMLMWYYHCHYQS